jgi:hypothetical protein
VNKRHFLLRTLGTISAVLALGFTLGACAGLPGVSGTSWKEEALQHDGSKIIVKRTQSYGGRHEIGQSAPVKEHTISFTVPRTGKSYSWASDYGEDIGRTNFNLLALHILNGTPYLVVEPNLCLAYNKWGRPNPPYVIFKYDDKSWKRIPLSDLPVEFSSINLIVNNGREAEIKRLERELGYVSAEGIQKINSSLRQSEYRSILRAPVESKNSLPTCMIEYPDGHGGWLSADFFQHATPEQCDMFCARRRIAAEYCKCIITKNKRN